MALAELPPPTFDLDSWSSNYTGPLLPLRLAHVAAHCPSLAHQALGIAITATKAGKDVQLYNRLTALASAGGDEELAAKDEEWVKRTEDSNKRELVRLEGELRGYKNNLIRESIRMGQEDLAAHLLLTGGPPAPSPASNETGGAMAPQLPQQSQSNVGLNAAYGAYGKMRDYCTTPAHVASMTLHLLFTALVQAVGAQQAGSPATTNYSSVIANGNRLRSTGVKDEEMARLSALSSASSGLASLGMANYREAAHQFLSVPFEYNTQGAIYGTDFSRQVASGNDIAIYGGLCALAMLSRQDLMEKVLGGRFRAFLELEPHMRKAISLFTTAKYRACLDTLQRYYSDWRLDIFLGAAASTTSNAGASHVDILFARIREKSITSYVSSFSEVSLASLVEIFPPSQSTLSEKSGVDALESEVLQLIESGVLPARLDLVDGLLVTPGVDARAQVHQDALAAAEEVERSLRLRLHKINTTLAGLEVPRSKNPGVPQNSWGPPAGVEVGEGY